MSVYYPPVQEHENVIRATLRVIEGTHYGRPDDPHADAEQQYGEEQLALAARALTEAVDRKPADEQPVGWDKGAAEEQSDTLPEWLYQRFARYRSHAPSWSALADDDQAYWAHEAAAVRRAVARGGFKGGGE